ELGEHVDVHLREGGDAEDHHPDRGRDHEVAEPQARADDRAHEGPRWPGCAHSSPLMSYSVPSSSAAPTVTTAVPTAGAPPVTPAGPPGGPADRPGRSPWTAAIVIGLRR